MPLSHQRLLRCFVIGPMRNMNRLNWLAQEVVQKLLPDFDVITPEEGEMGKRIMDQVLLNLEQADILVADLTGNNPNVLYELGIYHAFGKPYIVVKEASDTGDTEPTPFDIADYRHHAIDFKDTGTAQNVLRPLLNAILDRIDRKDWFSNPVTDFFQSPIAEIPTAVGLAKNYVANFLGQLLPDIFMRQEESDAYQVGVWVETGERDADNKPVERLLTVAERDTLTLEILIPDKLKVADHDHLRGLKDNRAWPYRGARVPRKGRPFTLQHRQTDSGGIVLADVPSVLSTLNNSIRQRRRIHEQLNEHEWLILEGQELERFAGKCELFCQELINRHPQLMGRVMVTWRWRL